MKYLKILLIAVITAFTFAKADAQVVVKARVGPPVRRHYVHRRVIVRHPVRHYYWRRHHRYHRYR